MRIGIHMPQKGGFDKNALRVKELGCRSVQIFPGNPTGWKMGKLDPEECARRADLLAGLDIAPLVVHTAYLVNLASNNPDFLSKSRKLLHETMERAASYRAPYVVLHAGNHGGKGKEQGLKQVVRVIEEDRHRWPPGVKLLLENTAGSGTAVGADFKELAAILDSFPPGFIGACLDTAHSWAAGYDLGSPSGVNLVLAELNAAVGLDNIKVVHVNDTKVKLGSRVDRHAHIGEGSIGKNGFTAFLQAGWPEETPFILETPENGTEKDKTNLEELLKLAGLKNCK